MYLGVLGDRLQEGNGATYLLSSIRIVSMVYSRFQLARQGNFEGSTLISCVRQLSRRSIATYCSAPLIDTGKVYFGNELDCGRNVRVCVATVDVDTVDTVFVCTLWRLFQFWISNRIALEKDGIEVAPVETVYARVEGREWYHSSLTSSSRRHLLDRTSRPL